MKLGVIISAYVIAIATIVAVVVGIARNNGRVLIGGVILGTCSFTFGAIASARNELGKDIKAVETCLTFASEQSELDPIIY
jgi:hypothetical protein